MTEVTTNLSDSVEWLHRGSALLAHGGGDATFSPMTASAAAATRVRHPWVWAVLYFPYGLTFGFPAIALGFPGRRAGAPLSAIAGVVGMSWLAAGGKVLWAPLGDCSLSRNRAYLLPVVQISTGLVELSAIPLSIRPLPL